VPHQVLTAIASHLCLATCCGLVGDEILRPREIELSRVKAEVEALGIVAPACVGVAQVRSAFWLSTGFSVAQIFSVRRRNFTLLVSAARIQQKIRLFFLALFVLPKTLVREDTLLTITFLLCLAWRNRRVILRPTCGDRR
jgi:hypothetical protein